MIRHTVLLFSLLSLTLRYAKLSDNIISHIMYKYNIESLNKKQKMHETQSCSVCFSELLYAPAGDFPLEKYREIMHSGK